MKRSRHIVACILLAVCALALLAGGGVIGAGIAIRVQQAGTLGPVAGTVTAVDDSEVTVEFAELTGAQRSESTYVSEGNFKVSDRVQVLYYQDYPDLIEITQKYVDRFVERRTRSYVMLAAGTAATLVAGLGIVAITRRLVRISPRRG